jgi:hypothetical protein
MNSHSYLSVEILRQSLCDGVREIVLMEGGRLNEEMIMIHLQRQRRAVSKLRQ